MPEITTRLRPPRYPDTTVLLSPAGGEIYWNSTRNLYRYWNGTGWMPLNAPFYDFSLPSSPYDGQELYYVADATNGVTWHLRYNAGSASAYKWEFLGGPPLFIAVDAAETTASTVYTGLTTAGPTITLPLGGDYIVEIGARLYSTANGGASYMSYDIGATPAVDADALQYFAGASLSGGFTAAGNVMLRRRKTGLANVTLTAKYKAAGGGTLQANFRWMSVLPIRVG